MPPISRRDRLDLACALAAFLAVWLFLHGVLHLGAYAQLKFDQRTDVAVPKAGVLALILGFPACASLAWFLDRRRARSAAIEPVAPIAAADLDWPELRADLRAAVRRGWIEPELHAALDRGTRCRFGLDPTTIQAAPFTLELESRTTGQTTPCGPDALLGHGLTILLGDAGAGKTTALIEVAHELLSHAETHPSAPVPLFLPIGTWIASDTPFPPWLGCALAEHYAIPPAVVARLLAEKVPLTLLLESFDEISSDHRPAALTALREFRGAHPQIELLVTARPDALTLVGQSLLTKSDPNNPRQQPAAEIFRLLPLRPAFVEDYLSSFGDRLEILRGQLHDYPGLRAAAGTPLLLHLIVHLAAARIPVSEFTPTTPTQSWAEAIARRYTRLTLDAAVSKKDRFDATLTTPSNRDLRWLQRLARGLARQNQSTFLFPASLQPSWLSVRFGYYVLLAVFLILLGCSPLFLSLDSSEFTSSGLPDSRVFGEQQSFFILLSSSLGLWLAFEFARSSVCLWLLPENAAAPGSARDRTESLARNLRAVFTGLALGLLAVTAYYLSVGFSVYGAQRDSVVRTLYSLPGLASLFALAAAQCRGERGGWGAPDFTPLRLIYLRVRNFIRGRGLLGQMALRATASATLVFALCFLRTICATLGLVTFAVGVTLALILTLSQRARIVQSVALRLALTAEGSFPLRGSTIRYFLATMESHLFVIRQNRGWTFRHRLIRDVLAGESGGPDSGALPIPKAAAGVSARTAAPLLR